MTMRVRGAYIVSSTERAHAMSQAAAKTEDAVQHTPGPWVIHGRVGPTRPLVIGRDIIGPGYTVAHVVNPGSNAPEKGWANARLIAAAPDLLRVVQAYVRYMDDPDDGTLDIEETLQRDMRAAVSKATKAA